MAYNVFYTGEEIAFCRSGDLLLFNLLDVFGIDMPLLLRFSLESVMFVYNDIGFKYKFILYKRGFGVLGFWGFGV